MLSSLKSRCPHCQTTIKVKDSHVGKQVRCPSCKKPFVVDSVQAATASASIDETRPAAETIESASSDTQPPTSDLQPPTSTRDPRIPTPPLLGRFQLRELLGQGGFGRVYKAYDPQLDRYVALKVPTFGPDDTHKIKRFTSEAKAAAKLHHPNIVPTYESGQIEGQYYIASQFVPGQTLSQWIKNSSPLAPQGTDARSDSPPQPAQPADYRQIADWVRQLADALAYAHREGIVHRDIKPDNIMLDQKGVPQIMDFGLAKRLNDDSGMTTDGSIVGTPAYMPPEQARGDLDKVGPRSDQYSLSVVLYELLTTRRPFEGPPHSVIGQVISSEPPAPRTIRPQIPRDLEAICQKGISKDPEQRYVDCMHLSVDLYRWSGGAETRARPIGIVERSTRWCRRNPVVAGLTGGIILVTLVGIAGISAALAGALRANRLADQRRTQAETEKQRADQKASEAEVALARAKAEKERADQNAKEAQDAIARLDPEKRRADQKAKEAEEALAKLEPEKQRADQKAKEAEDALSKMEPLLYDVRINLAQRALESNEFSTVAEMLDLTRPSAGRSDFRSFEWFYLRRQCPWPLFVTELLPSAVTSLEFSPYGETIAAALGSGTSGSQASHVVILNARTGKTIQQFVGHTQAVRIVRFRPDEKLLASGGDDGFIRVWDLQSGKSIHSISAHGGKAVWDLTFNGDGTELASTGDDSSVRIWNPATGQELRSWACQAKVHCLSFGILGRIAGGCADGSIRLWNAAKGLEEGNLRKHVGRINSVSFSRDGRLLVSGGFDKTVRVWDVAKTAELHKLDGHSAEVVRVRFDTSGTLIGSVASDKSARIWDARYGREALTVRSHITPFMTGIDFSPDGRQFATGNFDRTVRLWEVNPRRDPGAFRLPGDGIRSFVLHPKEDLAVCSAHGPAAIVDTRSLKTVKTLLGHEGYIWSADFSPDGELVATAGITDRTLRIWDWRNSKLLRVLRGHTDNVYWVAFSPDGLHLASCGLDATARIWDVATGSELRTLKGHTKTVNALAFHPRDKLLATASFDHSVWLWNYETGHLLAKTEADIGAVAGICFSPDGERLATGSWDTKVRIWDAASLKEELSLHGHLSWVYAVAFSPDGRRIASGSTDGTVRLWDAVTGHELLKLTGQMNEVLGLSFSRDGRKLFGAGNNVRVWDATPVPE